MSAEAEADREIRAIAKTLADLQQRMGAEYWSSDDVREFQARLRSRIGGYGSWSADKLPLHQRSRMAARYESEFAHLLWPR